jgi:radical SAM superfamily enzyme YgiQ (UPF0313 family)
VFFFPKFASNEATAPLGILAVATPLLRAGYEVRIIDSTITPDPLAHVLVEIRDAVCLAISLVTGPMILETVKITREAKRLYPRLPIILGGWHPSLLPEQTLAARDIDIVVRGQGEEALLQIVRVLEDNASLAGIDGVGYKENGQIFLNPPRALKSIREMPPKAYELADFDAYERLCGRRWAMYISSFGCPYRCGYCTNEGVYGGRWDALAPDQVVEDLSNLVARYRLQLVWVVDDNFLVDRERALVIAEGLVRRKTSFDWSIQSSANLVNRLTVDELRLLRRSGLSQIAHGAESGSPKVLELMNKTFQKPETISAAADKCLQAGIRPSFNVIFGYPGEGESERRQTIDLIMDVSRRYPGAEFWTNIFTPYPGAPIAEHAEELGIHLPDSFEGWAGFFPKNTVLPWLHGRQHRRVQMMREYLRVAFSRVTIAADGRRKPLRFVQRAIRLPARWRLDHDFYAFPFEIWLQKTVQALV